MANTLQIPFRCLVKSGESQFSIRVPDTFEDQQKSFTFSNLSVAPDFFSRQVAKDNLDENIDLEYVEKFPISCEVHIKNEKALSLPVYQPPFSLSTVPDFIKGINKFMDIARSAFQFAKTPCFIDWHFMPMPANNESINAFVERNFELIYGTIAEQDKDKYYDALPEDYRKNNSLNNWAMPETLAATILSQIRVRLIIAPQMKVTFSNEIILKKLGFSDAQLESRFKNRQYVFLNTNNTEIVFPANNAPELTFDDHKSTVVRLYFSDSILKSKLAILSIKKGNLQNLKELQTAFNNILQFVTAQCNIKLPSNLVDNDSKVNIQFPESDAIDFRILLPQDLAEALGFIATNVIHKKTKNIGFSATAKTDDNFKKAVALVYDTGVLLCTVDQIGSNTTFGSPDKVLATLLPKASGILEYVPSNTCVGLPWVKLTHFGQLERVNNSNHFSERYLKFNLMRIYDNGETLQFTWQCNAYVYGILICEKV